MAELCRTFQPGASPAALGLAGLGGPRGANLIPGMCVHKIFYEAASFKSAIRSSETAGAPLSHMINVRRLPATQMAGVHPRSSSWPPGPA